MTQEEKEQWSRLYDYIKKEILLYDENQSIPSGIVLRIKGLCTGKVVANNSIRDKANYSYDIILYTFKLCKVKILSAIAGKTFNSEISKFIYISKIVESNINEVYEKVSNATKSQEKTENVKVDNLYHDGAMYKSAASKENKKFENLW